MHTNVRSLVGAVLLSGFAIAASPLWPASPRQSGDGSAELPVQPGHIVSLQWKGTLKGGETVSVLRVPPQFHLIVTRAHLSSAKSQRAGRMAELLFGVEENKWESEQIIKTVSGIGPVFRPDSELVIRNTSSTDDFTLQLFGYYAPATSWPPVPVEDIVTVNRTVTLGGGKEAVLVEVPRDRWLTMTTSISSYTLVEDLHGVEFDKPFSIFNEPQEFLHAFRPGSLVKIRNDLGGTATLQVQLTGYFTDALAGR